jgi:ribosome biogenesis protein ENP2
MYSMKLSNSSSVPVYTVSGSSSRSLPDPSQANRTRKSDPEYAHRVELLQDFEFEEASQCVRVSEDGEWVMSTGITPCELPVLHESLRLIKIRNVRLLTARAGTYKPQIHTHYLPNLSLSWARHTDTLNKTFLILSSDYSKTAHLQEDRSIEFHTPQGCHYSLRIPRYGRDLAYNRSTAELLVPAVGVNANGFGEVFRVHLEQGRFMREYEVDVGGDDLTSLGGGALQGGINTGSVNTAAVAEGSHNLMAFGTSIGTVEYWDSRSRARVATLLTPQDRSGRPQVTALDFHRSGITTAVGTSDGLIYLYDLRSPIPMLRKDHGYGYPVHTLQFLTPSTSTRAQVSEPKILSADKRILKIWDERDGIPWTSVEPTVDINCVAWCQDSGMFLTANEGKQQHAFFIPQLGPAPRWCSFLDNVVEELADDPNDPNAYSARRTGEVYDNYKFLTPPQLRDLNLDHLVGKTNLLRPYMHGYFVAQRLYEEARLIANPSSWEEERAKRVREKIDKERESRIRGKKKVGAKVNRKMAEKILEREEKNERRRAQRVLAQGGDEKVESVEAAPAYADDEGEKGLLADSRFARLFQEEDYAVDETSREFHSLNPSTKVAPTSNLDHEKGLTAVEEEAIDEVPGSDSDDNSDPGEMPTYGKSSDKISSADYKRKPQSKKSKKQMQMQVSSSKGTRLARDRSFASRAETSRPKERTRRSGGVVGEKIVTFEPQGGRKKSQPFDRPSSGGSYSSKDRRSASGNTFRRV